MDSPQELAVKRNYKDTVFRMIYRQKKELLELFNGLNGTFYESSQELNVYTLDNAIYMNIKNDVSVLLDSILTLYEQQSTVNPNMPLRDLMYVTRQLEKYIRNKSVYSSKQIKLPAPKFIVFYNGAKEQPERQVLKLSDAYLKKTDDPELELKVTMININPGYNQALKDKCRTLKEYCMYVERVRQHAKRLPVAEAVRLSVDECIQEGILADFLKVQKAEVIAMSIFEYNEEIELKKIREDEYELGWEAGKKSGIEAMVKTLRSLKLSKEETLCHIGSAFAVSPGEAAAYVEKFWE